MPDSPRPRPHLEVVDGGAESAPAAAPRQPGRRRNWIAWILAILLAGALGGVYRQQQTQERLEARIEGLTADLEAAEARLEAHRGHLEDVRGAVADLEALVSRDPEAGLPRR